MFLNVRLHSITKQLLVYTFLIFVICFFSSKKTNAVTLNPLKTTKPWVVFKHPEGAFSIELPTKPEYVLKEVKNPLDSLTSYKLHLYIAVDEVNHVNYIVRYNDFPQGTFLVDKALVFEETVKDLEGKGKIVYGPEPIKIGNYDGIEVRLMLENRYTICRMFIRGNRFYLLLKQNALEKIMVSLPDDFFSSFKLEPYHPPKLINYHPTDANFKLKLFDKPYITKDTIEDHDTYIGNSVTLHSANPNSGGIYLLEYSKIKDYYRIKSADSLYNNFETNLTKETDSLISSKIASVNGQKVKEFILQSKASGNISRTKIWIDEGNLIFMRSITTEEEAMSAVANELFTSYITTKKSKLTDFSTSKAQKIINGLSSFDTTIVKEANGALNYYEFSTDELPSIYSALQSSYPNDSTENGTRVKLIEILKDVNDSNTSSTLEALYKKSDQLDDIREAILYTIANSKQPNSYNTYLELLTSKPLIQKKSLSWKAFSPLSDSLSFAAANFNHLLPMLEYSAYREDILNLANTLLTSKDSSYVNLIKKHYNKLTSYALRDVNDCCKSDSAFSQSIYSYLGLMNEVESNILTDNFTNILLSKPEKWTSNKALTVRIKHGLKTDDKVILQKLDSLSSRYMVMEALSKANQLQKVPKKYQQQDEFAKLCLYETLADEDYLPEKIELLGKITEQDSIYYVFNIFYKEEDKQVEYIGIGGPYTSNSSKLNFDRYNAFTNWSKTREDWETQAKEMVAKLEEE